MSEALENAKEERLLMRQAVEKLTEFVQDMRGEFRSLSQTMQSTATTIATLSSDKCGQRLDVIENKNKHYDRILGTANSFAIKALLIILCAGAFGAGSTKLLELALK